MVFCILYSDTIDLHDVTSDYPSEIAGDMFETVVTQPLLCGCRTTAISYCVFTGLTRVCSIAFIRCGQ